MTGTLATAELASVAELASRSSVCWVGVGDAAPRVVWYHWHDAALCLVVGGGEQHLPGLSEAAEVLVVLRERATRRRAAELRALVQVLTPSTASWRDTAVVLRSARHNLPDPDDAPDRWARASTLVRLVPVSGTVFGTGSRR